MRGISFYIYVVIFMVFLLFGRSLGGTTVGHPISCIITDSINYCRDKPTGLKFYDGCRVCTCNAYASPCQKTSCKLFVSTYQEAAQKCLIVERVNTIFRKYFEMRNGKLSLLNMEKKILHYREHSLTTQLKVFNMLLENTKKEGFPKGKGFKNYRISLEVDYKFSRDKQRPSNERFAKHKAKIYNRKQIFKRLKRSANPFYISPERHNKRSKTAHALERKLDNLIKRKHRLDKFMSKSSDKVSSRLRKRFYKISKQIRDLRTKLDKLQHRGRRGNRAPKIKARHSNGPQSFDRRERIRFKKPFYSKYDNWSFTDSDEEILREKKKKEIKQLTRRFIKLRRKYDNSKFKLNILKMRKEEIFPSMNKHAELQLFRKIKKYRFYCIHIKKKLRRIEKQIIRKAKEVGLKPVIKVRISKKKKNQIIRKALKRLKVLRLRITHNKMVIKKMISNTRTKKFKHLPDGKKNQYKKQIHKRIVATRTLIQKRQLYLSKIRPFATMKRHHVRMKRSAPRQNRRLNRHAMNRVHRRYKLLMKKYKNLKAKRRRLKRRLLMYRRRLSKYKKKADDIRRKLQRQGSKALLTRSLGFYNRYIKNYRLKIKRLIMRIKKLNKVILIERKKLKSLRSIIRKHRAKKILTKFVLRKKQIKLLKLRIKRYLLILHKLWKKRVFSFRKTMRIKAARKLKIVRKKILKTAKRYHILKYKLHPHSFNHYRQLRLAKWRKYVLLRKKRYILNEIARLKKSLVNSRGKERKLWRKRWLSWNFKKLKHIKKKIRKLNIKIKLLSGRRK